MASSGWLAAVAKASQSETVSWRLWPTKWDGAFALAKLAALVER
jgi:hypothetical protein